MIQWFRRKVFFADDPARGLVFRWILLIFGSGLMLNILISCGALNSLDRLIFVLRGGQAEIDWRVTGYLVVPFFLLYTLFAPVISREYSLNWKWKTFWVVLFAAVIFSLRMSVEFPWEMSVFLLVGGILLLFPGSVYRKEWRWILLQNLCFMIFCGGLIALCKLYDRSIAYVCVVPSGLFAYPWSYKISLPGSCYIAMIYLGMAALIGLVLCRSKIYADLGGIKFFRVFNRASLTVLGVFAAFHLFFIGEALIAGNSVDRNWQRFQDFYGRSGTVDSLSAAYYRGNAPDAEFWKNFSGCYQKFPGKFINVFHYDLISPEVLEYCAVEVFNTPEFQAWQRMFDAPLPLMDKDFSGNFFNIAFPDFSAIRSFVRWEAVYVQYALSKGDVQEAFKAARRLDHVAAAVKRECFLISKLVFGAVEKIRMQTLCLLLGYMNEAQLTALKNSLSQWRADWDQLHQNAIFEESCFIHYSVEKLYSGGIPGWNNQQSSIKISPLRWGFPAVWSRLQKQHAQIIRILTVDDFSKVREPENIYEPGFFQILPAMNRAGDYFRRTQTLYLALEVLVEAMIVKRKTGSYPEHLPDLPPDPFTSDPMRYRFGKISFSKAVFAPGANPEKVIEQADVESSGLSVWGFGINRKDDSGISGWMNADGRMPDDPSLKLCLPE